jgi:hypothetical protein
MRYLTVYILSFIFFLFAPKSFGQDDNWLSFPVKNDTIKLKEITRIPVSKGRINYTEDKRTAQLIEFIALPSPPDNKVMLEGYRVQIFFSNDRELIDKNRELFARDYPEIETYIQYDAPNYSIKVGNYRTELQAEELRSKVSASFPSSIIQKTKIELPKLPTKTLDEIEDVMNNE